MSAEPGHRLILSLFPGIGLLDKAFEDLGVCVVRAGVFWGIIGGPPCQDFSGLRRTEPVGNGVEMLGEFARCVTETRPEWWLMENVARVPTLCDVPGCDLAGYVTQRFDINQGWYCDVTRNYAK